MKKILIKTKNDILFWLATLIGFATILLLYISRWKYELPLHPFVDESLMTRWEEPILAGNGLLLKSFHHPHLVIYLLSLGNYFVRLFLPKAEMVFVNRVITGSFVLVSNVFLYSATMKMTRNRWLSLSAMFTGMYSLYVPQYIYYGYPDAFLFGMSNIFLYLLVRASLEKNSEKIIKKWYPLLGLVLGIIGSIKYHGIIVVVGWIVLHFVCGNFKNVKMNIDLVVCGGLSIFIFLLVNFSILVYPQSFWEELLLYQDFYKSGNSIFSTHHPYLSNLLILLGTSYGGIGAVLSVIGLARFFNKQMIYLRSGLPLIGSICGVYFLFSRYDQVVGRNLAPAMPMIHYLIFAGIALIYDKLKNTRMRLVPIFIAAFIIVLNAVTMIYAGSYTNSYDVAERWIADNLEEGSTVYSIASVYDPTIDREKYEYHQMVFSGEEEVPPVELKNGEYYIDVEYEYARFIKRNPFPFLDGDEYMDLLPALTGKKYTETIANYTLVQEFKGHTYNFDWRESIGYFDFINYPKNVYYSGPTIRVFSGGKQ